MDRLLSSFVQDSIDAALAEYVAPKSLTLDLKRMLVGDDFKKDVTAYGVLLVRIISAVGFKEGDHSLGRLGEGSSKCFSSQNCRASRTVYNLELLKAAPI